MSEACLEPAEKRFGQRDFGKENQALTVLPQRLCNRLEIDFGLARSGHAVEQDGVKALADRGGE